MVDGTGIARRSIRAGGVETTYLEAGRADAAPLVLLHDGSFGSDAQSCWSPVLPQLAGRYRVLAPDLIGHGGTRKIVAFDRDPMTQRIEHVRDFCDTLLLDSPCLAGSSFGGGMVLRAAAAGSLRMRAGVSIGGPGGLFMRQEKFAVLHDCRPTEEWSRAVCERMVNPPAAAELVAGRLARSTAPGHFESLAAPRMVAPVVPPDPSAGDWRASYREALTRVAVPLLLIAGADDELLDAGWADELAGLLPGGRAVTVSHTRHQPHLDRPDEVAKIVLDFFDTA